MEFLAIALPIAAALLIWWLTRGLRKPWYPRFAVEAVFIAAVAGMMGLAFLGSWYNQSTINRGEPD